MKKWHVNINVCAVLASIRARTPRTKRIPSEGRSEVLTQRLRTNPGHARPGTTITNERRNSIQLRRLNIFSINMYKKEI